MVKFSLTHLPHFTITVQDELAVRGNERAQLIWVDGTLRRAAEEGGIVQ